MAFVGSLAAAQAGTVRSEEKISETAGGFGGVLDTSDQFGISVAALGDLDGDGNEDLAVGARLDDDGGTDQGAVWILFMDADGTVASQQKISETAGGFGGALDPGDNFGSSVAAVGDLDNDGLVDLAVGARFDDDGGADQGAVWILFLNANGTVASHQKISQTAGGFVGNLDPSDQFGFSVTGLGDLNNNGIEDLAVGAPGDDDGASDQGAVWVLFLNANGTVASWQKISETTGGFGGVLDASDGFGVSVAGLGDLDGNGSEDLAVGAYRDDDGGTDQGAIYVLFLSNSGTVAFTRKISETAGGFGGVLETSDQFGFSVGALDDLDGDGNRDLAVGAYLDDDGGPNQGAIWILFLNWDGTIAAEQKISETAGGFGGVLDSGDQFGISVAGLGDLDHDGNEELAVGAYEDDDGGSNQGAVWVLFLDGPPKKRKAWRGQQPLPVVVFPTPLAPIERRDGGPLKREIALEGGAVEPERTRSRDEERSTVLELASEHLWRPVELAWRFTPEEPLLLCEVAGARVEIDDGVARHVLYESEPGHARPMSVFADLAVLFPRATSETVFTLVGHLQGTQSFLENVRFHGGATLRNGSGENELVFVSAATPRAGAEWQAWIDVSAHPGASASLVVVSERALAGRATPLGELLVDVVSRRPLFTSLVPSSGATDVHELSLPAELQGRAFSLQALILDEEGSALTNAIDLVVGGQ